MIARSLKKYWPLAVIWLLLFSSAIYERGIEHGIRLGFGVSYAASLLYLMSAALTTLADRINRFTRIDLVLAALAAVYAGAAIVFDLQIIWLTAIGILAGTIIWFFSRFHFAGNSN